MTAAGINPKECTNPLTSLISMYPNQGSLSPYEKIPVLFRFSPRWNSPKQAFKMTLPPPLQQTFAVFVKIQIVGSGIFGDFTSLSPFIHYYYYIQYFIDTELITIRLTDIRVLIGL